MAEMETEERVDDELFGDLEMQEDPFEDEDKEDDAQLQFNQE